MTVTEAKRPYNPNRESINKQSIRLNYQAKYYLRRLQEITGEREGIIVEEALCALYLGLTHSKKIDDIRNEIEMFRRHSYKRPYDKKRRKIIDDPNDYYYNGDHLTGDEDSV
jgi:hypothetical protein